MVTVSGHAKIGGCACIATYFHQSGMVRNSPLQQRRLCSPWRSGCLGQISVLSPNLILGISDELPPGGDIEKVRLVSQIVRGYEPRHRRICSYAPARETPPKA